MIDFVGWLRRLFPPQKPPPPPRAPFDCPMCACRIEPVPYTDGAWWTCVGCRTREEVVAYLGRMLPAPHINFKEPCGWKGQASDFGTKWA